MRVERQPSHVLRAEELEPQGVRQQRAGHPGRHGQSEQECPGHRADLAPAQHRVEGDHAAARQRGQQQHLLADEHLVGDQQSEDQPVAHRPPGFGEPEDVQHDEGDQELGDHVQMPRRVRDQPGCEPAHPPRHRRRHLR
jgi:hypothetical protein